MKSYQGAKEIHVTESSLLVVFPIVRALVWKERGKEDASITVRDDEEEEEEEKKSERYGRGIGKGVDRVNENGITR